MKRRITQPSVPLARKLPNLLSVEEVASGIGRHPEVVRRQARDGRLPAEKIGRVWFFRPERLAEAGFTQFMPQLAASARPQPGDDVAPATALLRALSDAGLQALQHPDRTAIFEAVGSRLAEAGLSTFVFDLAPDKKGMALAFRRIMRPPAQLATLTGHKELGVFYPFERIPVLHEVCQTLQPRFIGDPDELVGRVALAMQPERAANARPISEFLELNAVIAAPLVVADRAVGAITVLGPTLREADLPAVMAFANQTSAALEAARAVAESREMEEAAVLTLAGAIEMREAFPSRAREHAAVVHRFAQHLGFDQVRSRRVRYAALLQDLGKLSLPDTLIKKRGRLDAAERALFMSHTVVAADLLAKFRPLTELAAIVRSHHESFDGEGYPDGLRGEAIPLETRVISVVNAFFNVTFDLPHKSGTTVDDGLAEMMRAAGTTLDPTLTSAFVGMCREAAAARAPWYSELVNALVATNPVATRSAQRDILGVADSRELRIIYRIAQETTAVLDLDTLLNRIVDIIRDVMGYYMVSVLLPSDQNSMLRVGANSGYRIDLTGTHIPTDKGVIGWVFTNGAPQIVPDVRKDLRYIKLDERVRSKLAFPLISRGKVVGVLNAESEQVDAFSESDVALMTAVGSQLASSLEVAQLHDTLKREASHDPLTRLYNRRMFLERIQQEMVAALTKGESFSILFLDVDELKRINDTYGHLAGDALLREVSNALMDAVRGEDVVARYGGDEFVVLLPSTSASAAATVAARIADGIARHRFLAGRELLPIPGVSLGVATFPDDGRTPEELLGAADATLYRQKRKAS